MKKNHECRYFINWHNTKLTIHSNIKVFVQQQQYFFNSIWQKATSIKQKIKEIEKGIKPEKIETMTDSSEIGSKYLSILEKATNEILLIFPTLNFMQRQFLIGVFQVLKKI